MGRSYKGMLWVVGNQPYFTDLYTDLVVCSQSLSLLVFIYESCQAFEHFHEHSIIAKLSTNFVVVAIEVNS